ncbi:MAG: hypothetical protein HY661_18110 [Betaproteobacteria bacterium]|nr:hypothetical protein [Betaproteobacteria bacterium]
MWTSVAVSEPEIRRPGAAIVVIFRRPGTGSRSLGGLVFGDRVALGKASYGPQSGMDIHRSRLR